MARKIARQRKTEKAKKGDAKPFLKRAIVSSLALGLCLAAALWPAISTGLAEPLRLLQVGRTAM